jgi:hypothetical protein
MNVDLDIDNYELDDILKLFKLRVDFDESDLKRAKQIVLKTHPDKSKLSPDYFLFYSKAYKMIYSIWEFRKKGDVDAIKNTEYSNYSEKEKGLLLDTFFESNTKIKSGKNFNEWFNKEFIKNQSKDKDKGYGDWMQDVNTVDESINCSSTALMHEEIEKRKHKMSALIKCEDIQDYSYSCGASELTGTSTSTYDSGLFSGLQYQDLYKAHTETLIPVSQEDYEKKQKFKNINEFVSHRNGQDIKPLSEIQALQYLNQKNMKEEEMSTRRAYDLAKQTELSVKQSQEFWSGIQLLK